MWNFGLKSAVEGGRTGSGRCCGECEEAAYNWLYLEVEEGTYEFPNQTHPTDIKLEGSLPEIHYGHHKAPAR